MKFSKFRLRRRNGGYSMNGETIEKEAPVQIQQPQVDGDATDSTDERGQWSNQAEFILSCLGYAMGLGNVWKFPYTCYSNGGGAYLIPYILVLAILGIPTFFLELVMGQWSGKGPVEIWILAPIFQGAGLGMLLISAMICVFYTMLLTYCLYYFAMCFQKNLPWDTCTHSYNTELCFNVREVQPCRDAGGLWYNKTCYNYTDYIGYDEIRISCDESNNMTNNCTEYVYNEQWEALTNVSSKLVSSSQEYFYLGLLELSKGIDEPNGLKWQLILCSMGMWILCFLCLIKGIESSGKVVYFTTTFPYVVLTILLIRGAMLEGSTDGVKYYLTPDWNRLKDAKVWGDAAGQIFFALSVGAGGLFTYASYNKFHSNIYRNALLVASLNACTDWYAGFVVFCALGYMSHTMNLPITEVAQSGAGLAFIVYPQTLSTLPVPQLWTALFFFMLILLGLDSLNASIEAIITATVDRWPHLRKYKAIVTLCWCILFFLLGLPMCTRAGYYWLDLVSYYGSGWILVVMGIIESVVFSWFYGVKKVMSHVEEMVGFKLYPHWWVIWALACPLLLTAVLIFNLVDFKPLRWNDVDPPTWVPALGWLMTISPLALMLIVAVIRVVLVLKREKENYFRNILKLFRPTSEWMSAKERAEREKNAQTTNNLQTVATISTSDHKNNGFNNEAFNEDSAMKL